MKTLSRSRITQIQTECVTRYYVDKNFSVHLEVGLNGGGKLRADVFAMNTKGHITIVEIKSSWADFASDKKWRKYLDYCNQFYFCIPAHLYDSKQGQYIRDVCKENKVGLMVIGNSKHKFDTFTVTKKNDKLVGISRVFMNIVQGCPKSEVETETQFWLFRKLAWRSGLSVANVKVKQIHIDVESEYQYEQSLREDVFMRLDPLEQYQYLKKFPKSSFKTSMRDVVNRLRFEKTYLARLKKKHMKQV